MDTVIILHSYKIHIDSNTVVLLREINVFFTYHFHRRVQEKVIISSKRNVLACPTTQERSMDKLGW